jgi:hypothetical protein
MRITEQMIDAFDDAADVIGTYATEARDTAGEVAINRADIFDGLVAVAPMIAEAAVSGFIEQGARLKEAEGLLRRVLDPERNEPVFRDIEAFLA